MSEPEQEVKEVEPEVADRIIAEAYRQISEKYFLIPKTAQNRFRVETVGEQSEGFKDSGLSFGNPENAEKWVNDYVNKNISWRVLFETMQVVKFFEYKPPYHG